MTGECPSEDDEDSLEEDITPAFPELTGSIFDYNDPLLPLDEEFAPEPVPALPELTGPIFDYNDPLLQLDEEFAPEPVPVWEPVEPLAPADNEIFAPEPVINLPPQETPQSPMTPDIPGIDLEIPDIPGM